MNTSFISYRSIDEKRLTVRQSIMFYTIGVVMSLTIIFGYVVQILNEERKVSCQYDEDVDLVYNRNYDFEHKNVSFRYNMLITIFTLFHSLDLYRSLLTLMKIRIQNRKESYYMIQMISIFQDKEIQTKEQLLSASTLTQNQYRDTRTGKTYLSVQHYKDEKTLIRIEGQLKYLQMNDLIFVISFIVMHMILLDRSSDLCKVSLLAQRGDFLTFMFYVYWSLISVFVCACLCYRCVYARDDYLTSIKELDEEDLELITSLDFKNEIKLISQPPRQ